MPKFVAISSRGLLDPLALELEELNLKFVKKRPDAVEFDGSWADAYRVHLRSKLASRILLPVADFDAYNEDELYNGVLRKHDFTKYITPRETLRVEAHVREHKSLTDQRFVALKTKDALCDQFRKKFNERPSVGDEETADLRVVVRIVGTKVSLALDLTGDSLSNRGYRRFTGDAPLRENVAAGLLLIADWNYERALVDPFCGSGTILIEAALLASGAPALKRSRPFAFQKLRGFQEDAWNDLQKSEPAKPPPAKPYLFGYDKDPQVLEKARANARAAGVEGWITFATADARSLSAPDVPPGWIVTNPPYGERLSDKAAAKQLMTDFAATMKKSFKGWDAWILSGDPEVSAGLKLKAKLKVPVWNGPIECRFLNYPIT